LPEKSPAIVFIHGGAWQSGSKSESYVQDFGNTFASLGYVVAAINYRLLEHNVPETHGPGDLMNLSVVPEEAFELPQPQSSWTINAGIEDAAKAIAYMRDNAGTYDVDTNRIGMGGASAGAINSLAHAYNNPIAHEAPQVVLSYVGALIGAESLLDASDDVPAFVVNGDADPLIPIIAPNTMVSQMNTQGIYNEYYVQPGVGHTVDFNLVFDGDTLAERNVYFLAQYLAPEPSSLTLAALAALAFAAVARRRSRGAAR
jgi:acetyl esterase/lipase